MNFRIEFTIAVGEHSLTSVAALEQGADLDVGPALTGTLVFHFGDRVEAPDFDEPLVRLAGSWLRKTRWLVGGDTETLPLRNSEQCFAFIPTGGAVEISFFEGDEAEIDEYIIDPVTVRMDEFAKAALGFGRGLIAILERKNPDFFRTDEDCKDLKASLADAEAAWRDHQVHQRR